MCHYQTTHHHPVADIVIVIVVVADVVVVVVFVGVGHMRVKEFGWRINATYSAETLQRTGWA
jgi:hypothetical protein